MKQKRSKYKVDTTDKGKSKRTVDGILFDSELEAKYYQQVILPAIANAEISDCTFHPKYMLQDSYIKFNQKNRPIYYVADFEITYADGDIKIIDIKGMATETALLKRKWFDRKYDDKILEWLCYSKQDGGWIGYDELIKLRSKRRKEKSVEVKV